MAPSRDAILRAAGDRFREDPDGVEKLLRPLVDEGDLQAISFLGMFLTLREEEFHAEGVSLLERAVAGGSGHAAHNLAVYFAVHGDEARAQSLYAFARDAGFYEGYPDENWWRRP